MENKSPQFNWFKLLIAAIIPFLIIMSLFITGIKYIGFETYARLQNLLVENFGYESIFMFVYLVDTFIVPFSVDLIFPLLVNLPYYIIVPLIGIASTLGGITGYYLGYLCSKIPFIRRLTRAINAEWGAYLDKYGIVFIILSALTPIPYSTISWLAGALKYNKRKAFPAFLFRIVRMAVYYFLFKAGLSTILL